MASKPKQLAKAAASIVLAAAWCCFIFFMSANTGDVSQGMSDGLIAQVASMLHPGFSQLSADEQLRVIELWSFPVRKAAHFSEYALFGVLALNAVVQVARARGRFELRWALVFAALAFCVLFAAGDEFHQLFVDGRSGQLRDVIIDSCGAAVGVLIARCAFTPSSPSRRRSPK